eukprot:1159766-Pelagomonas_calceolata.AAC.2
MQLMVAHLNEQPVPSLQIAKDNAKDTLEQPSSSEGPFHNNQGKGDLMARRTKLPSTRIQVKKVNGNPESYLAF